MAKRNGSELICGALESVGVKHVFGLPGTQNTALFEALRRSQLRTVLATDEAGAGFMANGYYRASGRLGVFITIGGPGFTNALTPLAEARHDSAAVLHIVNAPPAGTRNFQLQAIDQEVIAGCIAKAVFTISEAEEASRIIRKANNTALDGEPGPVVVQVTPTALTGAAESTLAKDSRPGDWNHAIQPVDPDKLASIVAMLRSARRPVIYAGQGCNRASDKLIAFAELIHAPVIMTRSGRGVVPMDHRLALAFDHNQNGATGCNEVLAAADLIVVLGCKLTHNGTAGFRIQFPPEKMLHVDTSSGVLGASYKAAVTLQSDVSDFLSTLLARRSAFEQTSSAWAGGELAKWRNDSAAEWGDGPAEPKFPTIHGENAKALFDSLRTVLPRNAIVVTDSGLHQVLAFRYLKSMRPAGIIAPSDFQSMGFGIRAAIGAKLACPECKVVAIVGDGGMAMSGMELVTAVREKLQLGIIVFNDGALGQIRLQQLSSYGAPSATALYNPDFSVFAEAIGAFHTRLEGSPESALSQALSCPGTSLIEVPIEDSRTIQIARAKGVVRRTATAVGARSALHWLKSQFKAEP